MNNLHDPHKKTSIDQLLNPLATRDRANSQSHIPPGPPLSSPPHPHHSNQHIPGYPSGYASQSSFNLRAASWEMSNDTSDKDNGAQPPRSYPQHSHMHPTTDQPTSRLPRPQGENASQYSPEPRWLHPHEMPPMMYGHHPIAPMYSDERTAMSGDYSQQHPQYPQPYSEASGSSNSNNTDVWQTSQRASARLVARGTMHPPPDQRRYMQAYYAYPYPMPYPPMLQMPHMPVPQTGDKRPPPPDVDDVSTGKQKKPKGKPKVAADNANSSSRRGYNAKKRSEAAQIAAQNVRLNVSYSTDKSSDSPNANKDQGPTDEQSGNGSQEAPQLQPELQYARCMSNRYKEEVFPRCVSCTRRWAGDTCRFQGIRYFLKDPDRNIVGISFVEAQRPDLPSMNFPAQWNIDIGPEHMRATKITVARALLPILEKELLHLSPTEVIRRPRESDVRATCDTCMTSIFSSTWMCRICGREACSECFEQVRELTIDKPGAGQAEIAALQARREKHAHSNPFFLSCTRRNEHTARDFCPVSRFCKTELEEAIKEMKALLKEVDGAYSNAAGTSAANGTGPNGLETETASCADEAVNASDAVRTTTPPDSDPPLPKSSAPPAYVPPDPSEVPSHDPMRFTVDEMTDELFARVWKLGEPLVVTGVLPRFQVQWTPEYFIEKYGNQACLIIECQTDANKRVNVADFFSQFGQYKEKRQCWKLKDWPPSSDFKTAFPELYEDFASAVPVPNFVRRDGVMNIASHFPSNTISPDLGPKMYNAFASSQQTGSKGTTRLHMDMADAVNVMTFACDTPDGIPGYAAWDLFRSEDSDKIRQFFRKRFKGAFQHDPIHSQQFYLDEKLRKELADAYGVRSYRVYQRPGEAVFIPAGCAHQVCNMADCIKVAVDFVSLENISRCEKLTAEFREQNQSMVWKEDVLQLRTMMWFAWLSCCRQERDEF